MSEIKIDELRKKITNLNALEGLIEQKEKELATSRKEYTKTLSNAELGSIIIVDDDRNDFIVQLDGSAFFTRDKRTGQKTHVKLSYDKARKIIEVLDLMFPIKEESPESAKISKIKKLHFRSRAFTAETLCGLEYNPQVAFISCTKYEEEVTCGNCLRSREMKKYD